jgi:penicillin-binding protein 1C
MASAVLAAWYWLALPSPLFTTPTSTVLEDNDGKLMGAKIADDGQWRFPNTENVPDKFAKALVQFEDRQFYNHPGVNVAAFTRAMYQNITKGKVVSGGSTLTMQVIRLARKGRSRTFYEKFIEFIMATRLELSYSKKEILGLYASNAPFGSNVVGLDAAAWRYFGRSAEQLSWAEAATLAILPNSPSLIYPGKNQERLKTKRDRLLDRLRDAGEIDAETCELSKQEPLPGKPYPIPQNSPHLLTRVLREGMKGQLIRTTVDGQLQERVTEIIEKHHRTLKANEIHNAAALVLDVQTGNVIAYVGNTQNPGHPEHGSDVDVITAPRSTGSILKPFLYASMLTEGELLPNSLVPDIPTQIGGYAPKNYNLTYDGAIPAKRALARSLNVPAVRMLQNFGLEKFHYNLKRMGMTTLRRPAEHYGLSIILGGAEGKLWDLAGIYASMARTLNNYPKYNGKYNRKDFHPANFVKPEEKEDETEGEDDWSFIDAASIYLTFEAMVEVARPDEEQSWREYTSSSKIAWKTGTSFGYRDGWAIGVTPKYVVAVWVGNADGEGRPGLVGLSTAAPVMFDIFSALKPAKWFSAPYDEMEKIPVCRQSGCRATDLCDPVDTMWVQKAGLRTKPCQYHRLVHLDASGKYRVTSDCEDVNSMLHRSWFVLPPAQEWYYKSKNPTYQELPPFREDCAGGNISSMELIYPKQLSQIYIPVELDGTMGKVVFEVAHRRPNATIHWHVDDEYAGSTSSIHQLGLSPDEGPHILTLVDENGETLSQKFEVVSKKR